MTMSSEHQSGLLLVNSLTKYFGGVTAVQAVCLEVHTAEIVGVIGANGAGKTTLFDLISGFIRPDRGSMQLRRPDGTLVDLARCPAKQRAYLGIGRTFQNARLFGSLSVLDNLRVVQHSLMKRGFWASLLGMGAPEEEDVLDRAYEAMTLVGLEGHMDKPVQELSYGMLRLCELACVVALRPRLLLLDEPTSGMAEKEVEALVPLLLELQKRLQASVLIIEHDVPFIMEISDRLVAMASGQVISEGLPDEVVSDPDVIESYLGSSWQSRVSPLAVGGDAGSAHGAANA